jgi:formate hydrogenlyase subunit 3/multisubunit Na+/H+ antiporter MnhD subunit
MALLILFAWLGAEANSMEFARMAAVHPTAIPATIMFLLALVGFGVKAGFLPLHVWLPEAHPAAPSHVSALMSGVMIKTGIYGILRAITLIGFPTPLWGWTLLLIGVASGVAGVANALAQHDLKRLLAYHSVENIGIIGIGLGTGLLGLSWNNPTLVFLGFGGGLLHVLNHAVFKSLLFFGAGAVAHETGSRDIERMGGLLKRMPVTGIGFLVGSAAIAGLPPLNGFVSEFYIYLAGISSIRSGEPGPILLAAAILIALALIGGLAVACFAKAFGIVFLGEPRSNEAATAHEAPIAMRMPMQVLGALCVIIALSAPLTVRLVSPVIALFPGVSPIPMGIAASSAAGVLGQVALLFVLLIALIVGIRLIRRNLPRGTEETVTGTWDCGYARPTVRMQYTASSFAQPLTDLFATILGIHRKQTPVRGVFPQTASFETHSSDAVKETLFAPVFRLVDRWVAPIRRLQHGNLHGYLLYIALTLIILLIWKVGF